MLLNNAFVGVYALGNNKVNVGLLPAPTGTASGVVRRASDLSQEAPQLSRSDRQGFLKNVDDLHEPADSRRIHQCMEHSSSRSTRQPPTLSDVGTAEGRSAHTSSGSARSRWT